MATQTKHAVLAPVSTDGPMLLGTFMGVNLELSHTASEALASNRLRNAKFAGPADPQTGIAAEWLPFGFNMGGMHAKVVDGMFLSPSQSQLLHCYTAPYGAGLVQPCIPIRKGEVLEFKIWAKVRHAPTRLLVSMRATPSRNESGYANAEILVDTAYWKLYTAELPIFQTDEAAHLFLLMTEVGVLLIDQVSLKPKNAASLDEDVQDAILRLNPPAIRYPGGCMSTNHHWQLGLGPQELRPALADPVFKGRTEYIFGTDDYLELTHLLGATPHITVNVGSGTPREAADWAAHCRRWYTSRNLTPPLAYFQIGNEQYGPWETSHMTAEMYVAALKEFIPGIREAYPGCRIIALSEPVSTGVAGRPDTPFRQQVLEHARDLVDVLALNRYKGQWYDDPEEQLQNAVDSVEKIQMELALLVNEARAAGWIPRVALTEWNYWLHAAHWDGKGFQEPDDAMHGIFFSGVLHALFRASENVELASFYHLLNSMGLITKSKGRVTESAIGTLYRVYRSALPGRLIELNQPAEFSDKLDCLAISQDEKVHLFLRYWHTTEETSIVLDDAFGQISGVHLLAATDCYSPMKSRPFQTNGRQITLPPLSITKVELIRSR